MMNLFENLTRLNEKNADDVINQFIEAEIPFEDNSTNNVSEKIGRFTLFNGLIEIFEPDEDVPGYKAVIVGELSDVDEIINGLKEDEVTSEQIAVVRSLVEDRFETFDGEDVHEVIINAFPVEEIETSEETPKEVDEVVIEEESVKVEATQKEIAYKTSHRIDYIKDTLDWVESLDNIPVSINQLVVKIYDLASFIEDEITKINK